VNGGRPSEIIQETFRLKHQLKISFRDNPDQVRKFFRPKFFVDAMRFPAANQKINGVRDEELKVRLKRYAEYALRYGVIFGLSEKEPHFRVQGAGFSGNRFHVVIRNGQLEPFGGLPAPDEEILLSDTFESDEVSMPSKLKPLIEAGSAKYVLVDDNDDYSPFRQLMDFAYSPDKITMIEYRSTLRHQLYLIGEHVALNPSFDQFRAVSAQFQRNTAGHTQQGSPGDLRRLYEKLVAIVRRRGSMEDKISWLIANEDRRTDLHLSTKQSRARELRKKQAEMEKATASPGQQWHPRSTLSEPKTALERRATMGVRLSQLKRKLDES
jgi:hypothetical protein